MNRRSFLCAASGTALVAVGGCAIDPKFAYTAEPVSAAEHERTIAAMKPPKRSRPIVAVLCDNMGTETTDLIVPWSILTRSGVADVFSVSTGPGPVTLHPAMKMRAQKTIGEFEVAFPDGPDYVIVPAYHDPSASVAVAWIKRMSSNGSTVVGVCEGGLTVAHAGLLEGRQGTTHWYSVDALKKISPNMTWRQDRRYVADNGIITTTGVSASIPVSLALIEAISGRTRAEAVAHELRVRHFDESHDSSAFRDADGFTGRGVANALNVFGKETHAVRVSAGVDELTLAVTADAWSRTYRSSCLTAGASESVKTLNGLDLLIDRVDDESGLNILEPIPATPGDGINAVLSAIAARYGKPTASFVALQLEYPWTDVAITKTR